MCFLHIQVCFHSPLPSVIIGDLLEKESLLHRVQNKLLVYLQSLLLQSEASQVGEVY